MREVEVRKATAVGQIGLHHEEVDQAKAEATEGVEVEEEDNLEQEWIYTTYNRVFPGYFVITPS